MDIKQAYKLADRAGAIISPLCERVEIAGSIRRGKLDVHDIDIVVVPKLIPVEDLFGAKTVTLSALDDASELLNSIGRIAKNGQRYKQIHLPDDINLELWIVLSPAQWGVIYTLRTGPADFGHWLVTPRQKGGALPSFLAIKDGAVYNGAKLLPTPEERDFFQVLNMEWVEPGQRMAGWKR